MDSERAQWLLDKYWKSESSRDEELELRKLAQDKKQAKDLNPVEKAYLNMLDEMNEVKLDDSFDKDLFEKIERAESLDHSLALSVKTSQGWSGKMTKIAASVLIILASGMIIFNASQQRQEAIAQREAREAFELTRQALLLVSAKLNKGASYTTGAIGKFDEAQKKVKRRNENI